MFCTSCGRENKQGNKFCAGCGTPLVENNTNVVESTVVNNTPDGKVDELNGTLLKIVKIMFIIGGGLVIICLGIAIFTIFYLAK